MSLKIRKFTIYPCAPGEDVLVGYKGDQFAQPGFVYAPYIPIQGMENSIVIIERTLCGRHFLIQMTDGLFLRLKICEVDIDKEGNKSTIARRKGMIEDRRNGWYLSGPDGPPPAHRPFKIEDGWHPRELKKLYRMMKDCHAIPRDGGYRFQTELKQLVRDIQSVWLNERVRREWDVNQETTHVVDDS